MPAQIHLGRTQRGKVPVQNGRDPALGVEDQVAQAHVAPQQHRGALGRHVPGAPLEALGEGGQRIALRRPVHVGLPALDGVAQLWARQHRLEVGAAPLHRMDRRHRVEEPVVHDALQRRPGVAHVGIEERRRTRDVAGDPRHDEEGRSDPIRIGDRRAPAPGPAPPPRPPRSGRPPAVPGRSRGRWARAAGDAPPSRDGRFPGRPTGSRWPCRPWRGSGRQPAGPLRLPRPARDEVGMRRDPAPQPRLERYAVTASSGGHLRNDSRQERTIGTDERRVSIIGWASMDGSASGS